MASTNNLVDSNFFMELQANHYHSPTWQHVLAITLYQAKVLQEDKPHRALVEYLQLNTLATMYNLHFGHYSKGKKHVTQLILGKVWKSIYLHTKQNTRTIHSRKKH
jgi:hypothetical protein